MEKEPRRDSPRPQIDDSVLDRHLRSLPAFYPYPGFEDRVMSRVYVPPPRWMQIAGNALRSLVETRRARWLWTGLLATSAMTMVVATTLALSNLPTVSRVVDSAARIGLPLWQATLRLAADSVRGVYAFAAPLIVSRDMALKISAGAVVFLILDALVLLCLMSPNCFARSE